MEVHLRNIAPGSLGNSELLHHIMNELRVPLITMCAYDDGEAFSEHVVLRSCFHVLKPLHTGSLNMLKQKALEHKSKKATPQGPIPGRTERRIVSSSAKRPREMLILERNNLSNPESNEFELPEVCKAHGGSKKPGRVSWTVELHEKFLDAVEVLGDKRAKPEGIRKLMNVEGLAWKNIASHLQKHRLRQRNAKQGGQHQMNASTTPVSELIGSAHNADTTESITTGVDLDIRELYPSRLWTQVKEAAALKNCTFTCTSGFYRDGTKSVWDEYEKGLQKELSASYRRRQMIELPLSKRQSLGKNNGVSSEAPKAAGEVGYGASIGSSGSSSLSTSLFYQAGKNNRNEATVNNVNMGNINMLEGTMNQEHTVEKDPSDVWALLETDDFDQIGSSDGMEKEISYCIRELEGSLDQQDLGLEDPLQVDIVVVEGTMNQEHTAAKDPSDLWALLETDDFDQIGSSDGMEEEISYCIRELEGSLDQQDTGLEDPLQIDNAWNTGLASRSLIMNDGSVAQEANAGNGPVDNPVVPIAQGDVFLQDHQILGLEDPLQVDNACFNTGLALQSLTVNDGLVAQEANTRNAPVFNPVMPVAQGDGFSQYHQILGLEDPLQVDNAGNRGLGSPSLINIDGPMAPQATVQNAPVYKPLMPFARGIIDFRRCKSSGG